MVLSTLNPQCDEYYCLCLRYFFFKIPIISVCEHLRILYISFPICVSQWSYCYSHLKILHVNGEMWGCFFWLQTRIIYFPFISHSYIFFPLEENVGKQIKWRVKVSLTLYTRLWVSSRLWPFLPGLFYIYPLCWSNIIMTMHVASFGSHSQVINSPLADRESLGTYTSCIYYIRTDRPSLFNDPSSSFSEVCWSLLLNETKHHAPTQHSEDFGLFRRTGLVKDSCFGIDY